MSDNIISLDECAVIVGKLIGSDDVKVIDYEIAKYAEGYPGFLGDYFLLTVQFNDKIESRRKTFFVKSLPVANLEKRKVIEGFGLFKKETGIFSRLIPKLLNYKGTTRWAPNCFLIRDDLLVLEDLRAISYQTLPRHIDPNINHIKMALRSLAAFHAANIIYERLELRAGGSSIGDAYKDVLFETSYALDNPWCMTGIKALKTVALHKTKYGIGSSYGRAIEEEFMERVCKIFDLLEAPDTHIPRICCHRDLWKNNLMFKFDNDDFGKPSHCLLIDFQICRYLPLTLDTIICIMLPSRDHSIVDDCLKFYYERLRLELKLHHVQIEDIMSWVDFEVSCNHFKLFPLVQQGMFWSLTNLPDGFLPQLLAEDEKKYIRICNEDRGAFVLEQMENDEYYRETMTETVERLIEYLFVN